MSAKSTRISKTQLNYYKLKSGKMQYKQKLNKVS